MNSTFSTVLTPYINPLLLHNLLLLAGLVHRDNHHLDLGRLGRKDHPLVIRMHHHKDPNRTGSEPPTGLPNHLFSVLLVQKLDIEHLREVLSQRVTSRCLHGPPIRRDKSFHSGSVQSPRELLVLGLHSLSHGHRQQLFIGLSIEVEDSIDSLVAVLFSGVCGVPFLPEELSGPDERSGVFELPTDDIGPLVQHQGQVPVRLDPVLEGRVHDGLGSRSDGDRFLELALATAGHPGHFGGETFHMVLLGVERAFGHEHREITVFDSDVLEAGVEEFLDMVPDGEGPGT